MTTRTFCDCCNTEVKMANVAEIEVVRTVTRNAENYTMWLKWRHDGAGDLCGKCLRALISDAFTDAGRL